MQFHTRGLETPGVQRKRINIVSLSAERARKRRRHLDLSHFKCNGSVEREESDGRGGVSSDWRAAIKASGQQQKQALPNKGHKYNAGTQGIRLFPFLFKTAGNPIKAELLFFFLSTARRQTFACFLSQGECNLIARD